MVIVLTSHQGFSLFNVFRLAFFVVCFAEFTRAEFSVGGEEVCLGKPRNLSKEDSELWRLCDTTSSLSLLWRTPVKPHSTTVILEVDFCTFRYYVHSLPRKFGNMWVTQMANYIILKKAP